MVEVEATKPIRIAKISGRYLVFDPDAVALLRRHANINGTLVGTAPQQPTQNIFLGLPIELRPEEADALVRKKVAYIVDDVAAHQSALHSLDPEARKAYTESLRRRKHAAQKVFAEMSAKKTSQVADRIGRAGDYGSKTRNGESGDTSSLLNSTRADNSPSQANTQVSLLGVTPTSSNDHVSPNTSTLYEVEEAPNGALCYFLQGAGYYMTPGLRFGSQYSVYPGDPLRFHAHFMANRYGWEEEIPILDIVGGGRLATAVKKAFLISGQQPSVTASREGSPVRTFSIEWAGM